MKQIDDARQIVFAEWARVLGNEPKSEDENFFAVGGTSLMAAELTAGLSRIIGTRVRMAQLVRQPTPSGLATVLFELAP